MTKRKKSIIAFHAALSAVFCILAAVGTFFDLDISRALYMPNNAPALFITILGQYLYFAAFVFFDGVLSGQAIVCGSITRKKRNILIAVCAYLAVSTGFIGSEAVVHAECLGAIETIARLPEWLSAGGVFLLFMCPLFFVGIKLGRRLNGAVYDKKLVWQLIRLLIFITAAAYLMGLVKSFFARPRYRTTLWGIDGVEFLPWFDSFGSAAEKAERFGTDKNAFRSFPSGHAIMGISSIFIFPALAWVSERLKGRESLLAAIGLIYGLAVMLSRIILGAHFLTDVSVGAFIAVIVSLVYHLTEYRYKER